MVCDAGAYIEVITREVLKCFVSLLKVFWGILYYFPFEMIADLPAAWNWHFKCYICLNPIWDNWKKLNLAQEN